MVKKTDPIELDNQMQEEMLANEDAVSENRTTEEWQQLFSEIADNQAVASEESDTPIPDGEAVSDDEIFTVTDTEPNTEFVADNEDVTSLPKDPPAPKAKRAGRKKKVVAEVADDEKVTPTAISEPVIQSSRARQESVLTIDAGRRINSAETQEEAIWHEVHNAYRTYKILSGILGGLEQTANGQTLAIIDYKGFRVVIPLKEMMGSALHTNSDDHQDLLQRQNKIFSNMLGAEIDFVVKGINSKSRSIVASRREAMRRKRQQFYFNKDSSGYPLVYEGRIVQARIIAVAEKVVRVEVFGVEAAIIARNLSWVWIGDAREHYAVGDQLLVKVSKINGQHEQDISLVLDAKSLQKNTMQESLQKCRLQSKYIGKVVDIYKGVVYVRLSNGVNAVAHSCYDRRMPGKKDDVSFAVTRIDEDRSIAVGIITRIIKQNL